MTHPHPHPYHPPDPDDRLVASCSGDGTVRVTDLAAGSTRVAFIHAERAKKLAVEPGGEANVVLSCSEDGTSEWRLARGCGGEKGGLRSSDARRANHHPFLSTSI
jgi:hypothetical protein